MRPTRREYIGQILSSMQQGDRFTTQMIIDRCPVEITPREAGNLLKEFPVKHIIGHRRRGLNIWEVE